MKFAVLTDIHGIIDALDAVLNDIDRRQDIEHIYNLGDLIGFGPFSNEVLARVFARQDMTIISGNHDEAVIALIDGLKYPESIAHLRPHHEWIVKHLEPQYLHRLRTLPRIIDKTIEGQRIYMTHYHIANDKLHQPIGEEPFSAIKQHDNTTIKSLFEDIGPVDVVFFGHHHPQQFYENSTTKYYNPSSVGCQPQGIAPYAVVEVTPDDIHVEIVSVAYDDERFIAAFEKQQVPLTELIFENFLMRKQKND